MRRFTYWLSILLIFIVPWEDSISVSSLGSLAKVLGMVVAVFWMATILVDGRFRMPHFFHALVLLFFLWNFLSVIWSPNPDDTIQRIKTYSQIYVLILIYWEVFQTPEELLAGIQAYVYGTYVLIASTIYNYVQGNMAVVYEGRYSATGVNAVDLTLILMLGLPMAMQMFFAAVKKKKGFFLKFINLAYVPLAIFSILLTGSRTSLIAVIPFGVYLVGTRQIKFHRKFLVFGILLLSMLALLSFIPQSLLTRLGTLSTSIETGDIGGRAELWWQAILVFSKHPLMGLGSGALDAAIGSAAHNTFLSILAETGFVGIVLFIAILAIVLFQAINAPNGNAGLWVAILLTWAIGVNSLSWEFRKLTWLFLNFIVIEGSLKYPQSPIHLAQTQIFRSVNRFLRPEKLGSE